MAKRKKTRKRYKGKDSSATPQPIRIEAEEKSRLATWWEDYKQTVLIRLAQIGLLLLGYGLIRLAWSLLS